MGVNKIVLNMDNGAARVLVDLTGDNVTADSLVVGSYCHGADGEIVDGANPYELKSTNTEVETQAELIEQIKTVLDVKAAGSAVGIVPTGTVQLTENGTHDVTNYASAEVDVPIPDGYIVPSGTKQVTENGQHDVAKFANVSVNVPSKSPVIEPLTINENGVYAVPDGVDGYSPVVVNVAGSDNDSDLPAGYSRVDYIQFSGEQTVDTGIICNQNTKIRLAFTRERSTQHYLYGVASSDNTASVTAYVGGSWRFGNKYASKSHTVSADMIYSVVVDSSQITTTGSKSTISGVNDFETVGSLLLGACRNSNGTLAASQFIGKILFFSMWEGDRQVLKLIPVTDGNGVYRFFDMVSETFFDSITETPLEGGNL